MQGVRRTVISQYANSPVLLGIIDAINEAVDPAADFDVFYRLVWDLDTAEGYGLDVWGRIVGIARTLKVDIPPYNFGFSTPTRDFAPFGQAPFVSSGAVTRNYALPDDIYRKLILVKAAANIAACTPPVLNRLLTALFGDRGRCYVSDYGYMQMRYTFEFYLTLPDLAILLHSGVAPTPAGVSVAIVQLPPFATFGFAEAGPESSAPFGQAPMLSAADTRYIAPVAQAQTAPLDGFTLDVDALA